MVLRALGIIGAAVLVLYLASLAGTTFRTQPSPLSWNGKPIPMPAISLGQSEADSASIGTNAAGGGELQPCRPYKLTDELVAGHVLGRMLHAGDIRIDMKGVNGSVMHSIDTSWSDIGQGFRRMMVGKGSAITSASTNDVHAEITEPMGATYVVHMPNDRQPYKKVIFHLWGLNGSYVYGMYAADGTMLYDPPLRDVTFSPPGKYMPDTAYIKLEVRGAHALQIEAVC